MASEALAPPGAWLLAVVLPFVAATVVGGVWTLSSGTILGRSKRRILLSIPRFPFILWHLVKMAVYLKGPLVLIRHYLTRTVPPGKMVEFRNGLKIHLSDSPDDLVTVLVIFIRDDYGKLPVGGTVVDVGANIGAFSLSAARQGARHVFAFEANGESIGLVLRNAAANGLDSRIHAYQLAVTDQGGASVKFPVKSDPSNRIGVEDATGDYELVETISLAEIITRFSLDRIDLLKLDCEGAEYGIVLNSPDWIWDRVGQIRLEYHQSHPEQLSRYLLKRGFQLDFIARTSEEVGHLRFSKPENVWQASTEAASANSSAVH